jgi:hypothetical protein
MLSFVRRLQELFGRVWSRSQDGAGHSSASERPLDPTDAFASARSRDVNPAEWGAEGGGLPPNYVKSYDEGRPRK